MRTLVLILAFVAAIGGAVIITYNYVNKQNRELLNARSAAEKKAEEISAYLDYYFIDEFDEGKLADAAASAMVTATGDRWSYYLTPEQYAEHMETMNNAYVGIGITILLDEEAGGMWVEEVTAGSPAEASGILRGDLLVSVEGVPVSELGMEETRSRVKGEAGTAVHLAFSREGVPFELDVLRASIETPVATMRMLDEKIACIRIENFDARCADETIARIRDAEKQGAEGLIFDLRFNPGGLKDELVKVLDYLLPEGDLFRSRDYAGREEVDTSDASCLELPMAVLINEDSYSAAEFFAAALQEYDWATIVGMQTCGKGNMQVGFPLSDGSYLNISIAKYFTPGGVSLTDVGVTPDTVVDLDDESYSLLFYSALDDADDGQLQTALQELRQKMS